MRKISIISKFILLLIMLGLVTSANAQWPQTTAHNPWSLEIGAKVFDRPSSKLDIPLITDTITKGTLFDVGDATDLGTGPAAEIKFNFNTKDGQELEIRTILANWEETGDPILGPNLQSPFFPVGFVPDSFTYDYDADLYSFEIMGRRAVRPGLVLMAGPRVVSTKDRVQFRTSTVLPSQGGAPPVTLQTESFTEATNILIGLQGGLEFNRPVTTGFYSSSFIRVGGYYNPTEVTFIETNSITGSVQNQLTKSTGSFLGEVGTRLYMDFVPNCFSGYIGYEANWIDGLAVAPSQLFQPAGAAPAIETSNTPFFHGATFGVKFTY